jgi:hypothetical protein
MTLKKKTPTDDFFRVCPKCGKTWNTETDWLRETSYCNSEAHDIATSSRSHARVRVSIREHENCGGKMTV